MYQAITTYINRLFIVCMLAFFTALNIQANEHDALDRTVRISKNKGTIYELLKDISIQSGFLFIYDSQIINNDKKVKVSKGEYTLRDAIHIITGNKNLQIDLSGQYILLRMTGKYTPVSSEESDIAKDIHITIGGRLYDRETGEGVIFASVSILNTSFGIVTNQDGEFQLVVPDSLQNHKVRFSHIGYKSQEIDISLLKEGFVDIAMNTQTVLLKEVVVSAVNPESALNDMLNNRATNYAAEPVHLTTFYREGIDHNNINTDLTESVLQIYKTGHKKNASNDQVKLIKKRRIVNRLKTDTIFPKMRSGVNSCLILDIIKELPEFITPNNATQYKYSYIGKSIIDNKTVNIISFHQREHIREPLYSGELFIEAENKALVEVRFEINPKYAREATNMFVDKKAAGLRINLQQARYIVSYRPSDDGFYYINHVRGDIKFKVQQKKRLLSSPLNFWFEMVTCNIDKRDVKMFPRDEQLSTNHIFAETKHEYDRDFWKNFNIILPEEKLQEEIIRNLNDAIIMK